MRLDRPSARKSTKWCTKCHEYVCAAFALVVAGCGCEAAGFVARDADAVKSNERAVTDAIARAGFVVVRPNMLEKGNPNIAKPAVMDSADIALAPGKLVLVFPTTREMPSIVRDKSGSSSSTWRSTT